ncbi:hypothetical protein [Moorena producens]|nr:hypothetical protein [Moorena producens]
MQSLMGETPKTALHRLIKISPISPSPHLPISPRPVPTLLLWVFNRT